MKPKEENLKTALLYAELGWKVLPTHYIVKGKCTCRGFKKCKPGKHPMGDFVPNGVKNATDDMDQITQWWELMPYANIGIATGKVSDLFVLDVDLKNDGIESLTKLEQRGLVLPDTHVITGSGGYHYYFTCPKGEIVENAVGLLPGLDIRAEDGYVLAPPSNHISGGTYAWGV